MKKSTIVSFLSVLIGCFFSSEIYQDFICLICCSVFIFIFAYVFCKSVDSYLQRRQYQQIVNEIDKLLVTDGFLAIIKNGSQDVVDKQLHTNSSEKIQLTTGQI